MVGTAELRRSLHARRFYLEGQFFPVTREMATLNLVAIFGARMYGHC